jgi:hypothetical protein
MKDRELKMLDETLVALVTKIHELTGEDILIGWGSYNKDSGITTEGCVTSNGLEYPTACKLLCGLTSYAMDWYGNQEE